LKSFFFALFIAIKFVSHAQSDLKCAEKFISLLNDYDSTSLDSLLTPDFELKRNFVNYHHDRERFMGKYIMYNRNLKGKFKILETISTKNPVQFVVEDQSVYFDKLQIQYPTWKITLYVKKQQIQKMVLDSTNYYHQYVEDSKLKGGQFNDWVKEKYPNETDEMRSQTPGLLEKRLNEYLKLKKVN
jgi:hypothetical protein